LNLALVAGATKDLIPEIQPRARVAPLSRLADSDLGQNWEGHFCSSRRDDDVGIAPSGSPL
jgi:hypothetical protein